MNTMIKISAPPWDIACASCGNTLTPNQYAISLKGDNSAGPFLCLPDAEAISAAFMVFDLSLRLDEMRHLIQGATPLRGEVHNAIVADTAAGIVNLPRGRTAVEPTHIYPRGD